MSSIFTPAHLIRNVYTWPLDANLRLKELHMEGIAFTKIANILNEEFKGRINYLSRNSIAGKIQRMGLANKENRQSLRYMNRPRKVVPEPLCEPTTGGISLFEIKGNQCRYIADGQSLYCGADGISYQQPYCKYHAWYQKDENDKPKCVYQGFKSKQANKFKESVK